MWLGITLLIFVTSCVAIPSQLNTDLGVKLYAALVGMLVAFPACLYMALAMKARLRPLLVEQGNHWARQTHFTHAHTYGCFPPLRSRTHSQVPQWTSATIVGSFSVILACIPVGIGSQAYFRFEMLNQISMIPDSPAGWATVKALGDAPDQAVKGFNFAHVVRCGAWLLPGELDV